MRVLTILHHEQPVVTMRLLVGAGAAEDPQGKAGLSGLLGSLLDQGTSTRTAQEIADQIDTIGGALGTGSGSDLSFANVVVMKDSFGMAMELLADVVRNPEVRRRGDRPPEAAGDLVAAGQRHRPGLRRLDRCSTGWSTASIPTACPAAARPRRWPASRATTCWRSTAAISSPTT